MKEHAEEFGLTLAALAETFNRTLSKAAIRVYYEALKQYSYDDVNRALNILTRQSNSLPTIAKIINVIEGRENPDALAEQAYDKFNKARREIGAYQTVVFDDPIIHRIVELHGGWPAVCAMTKEEEQYTAFKRNFIQEYKAFLTDRDYEYPPKLPGIYEINNSNIGYEKYIPKPVLIGDRVKIFKWLAENDRKALERQAQEKQGKAIENKIYQLLGYKVALEDGQERKAI